jgi:hypothetical protein
MRSVTYLQPTNSIEQTYLLTVWTDWWSGLLWLLLRTACTHTCIYYWSDRLVPVGTVQFYYTVFGCSDINYRLACWPCRDQAKCEQPMFVSSHLVKPCPGRVVVAPWYWLHVVVVPPSPSTPPVHVCWYALQTNCVVLVDDRRRIATCLNNTRKIRNFTNHYG